VFQSIPVDGIVAVTSPQDLVSLIVTKAVRMANMMSKPILGVVENYSYFQCPNCGEKHYIFGQSNLEQVAAEAITSGEKQLGAPVPGIEILKRPDATAGELADLISGACPPFPNGFSEVHCDEQSCRACWLAWLTTGKSPSCKEVAD